MFFIGQLYFKLERQHVFYLVPLPFLYGSDPATVHNTATIPDKVESKTCEKITASYTIKQSPLSGTQLNVCK